MRFHQAGKLDGAIECYRKTLELQPNNYAALSNLGVALHSQGNHPAAIACYQKTIALKPDSPEAFSNLGAAYKEQGRLDEAIYCYNQAIVFKPDYLEALNNLGIALREFGNLEEAVNCYRRALRLKPDYVESLTNLGVTLTKLNRHKEAVTHYHAALALQPDSSKLLSNLGLVFAELGQLADAAGYAQRAVAIQPELPEIRYNLGNLLTEQGELEAAVEQYRQAILLKPDYINAINNLGGALAALAYDALLGMQNGATPDLGLEKLAVVANSPAMAIGTDISAHLLTEAAFTNRLESSIAKYQVKKIVGAATREDREEILANLPTLSSETIANQQKFSAVAVEAVKPVSNKKLVAYMGMSSAGSGLFHSQLDGHPEISIMPGVYMSGYFGRGVWRAITSSGYQGAAAKFANMYSLLFDARSLHKPPPAHLSDSFGLCSGVGFAEGFVKLGESQDTPLQLDREVFLANLGEILARQEAIDQGRFFEHVHHAYEATLGNDFDKKKVIVHHIHKLDQFSMSNLLNNVPDAKLLTIVRNPVQGCESLARNTVADKYLANDYVRYNLAVRGIIMTLRDVDSLEFSSQDAVGIRLEDVKGEPAITMRRLCRWLEIEPSPTLYESTIQGLKWWGEPSSVLFGRTQTKDQGADEPIRRDVGILFSKKDQHILATLFYPFNVRFGYVAEDEDKFKQDLQKIRPMLAEPLDFELNIANKFPSDYPALKMTAAYKYFHAMLLGRWRLLERFGTYQNMCRPLPQ